MTWCKSEGLVQMCSLKPCWNVIDDQATCSQCEAAMCIKWQEKTGYKILCSRSLMQPRGKRKIAQAWCRRRRGESSQYQLNISPIFVSLVYLKYYFSMLGLLQGSYILSRKLIHICSIYVIFFYAWCLLCDHIPVMIRATLWWNHHKTIGLVLRIGSSW